MTRSKTRNNNLHLRHIPVDQSGQEDLVHLSSPIRMIEDSYINHSKSNHTPSLLVMMAADQRAPTEYEKMNDSK